MDALPFVVGFVAGHVDLAVFVANTIDATGIPFPGRIVLILAGAFLQSKFQLVFAIIAGATGALLGDHLLYLAGQRGGPAAVLAWLARRRAVVLIFPAAVLAIVAYRLWRRWRYAPGVRGSCPIRCATPMSPAGE
jgi:membrane protein DedA with SNARE-associated domain